jgi:tetratricopeptide (TPR) repeat protein
MNKSDDLHLRLNIPTQFNVDLTLFDKTYHVQTECRHGENPVITTSIYLKGEIVYSKKTDCAGALAGKDAMDKLQAMIEKNQEEAVKEFTGKSKEDTKKAQYFGAVEELILRKNYNQALKLLEDALNEFPADPFIMSYYGYLLATSEGQSEKGIKICQDAFEKLDPVVYSVEKPFHIAFYLNFGKAYLAGGDKRAAVEAFRRGLAIDEKNNDLIHELQKLGVRKESIMPFLERDNPVNKYSGMFLKKMKLR